MTAYRIINTCDYFTWFFSLSLSLVSCVKRLHNYSSIETAIVQVSISDEPHSINILMKFFSIVREKTKSSKTLHSTKIRLMERFTHPNFDNLNDFFLRLFFLLSFFVVYYFRINNVFFWIVSRFSKIATQLPKAKMLLNMRHHREIESFCLTLNISRAIQAANVDNDTSINKILTRSILNGTKKPNWLAHRFQNKIRLHYMMMFMVKIMGKKQNRIENNRSNNSQNYGKNFFPHYMHVNRHDTTQIKQ